VFAGSPITGVGDGIDTHDRPNLLVSNPIIGNVNQWFNPAAFALPAPGHVGTASRTICCGPTFKDIDASISKRFPITESAGLLFGTDVFNLVNHPNFGLPSNQLSNPQAGQITTTVGVPREIQFSLKLTF